MNPENAESKPLPSRPWYRAVITRTPRGRRLRRRIVVGAFLLSLVALGPWPLGWDWRLTAARFGLYEMPRIFQRCHHELDCTGKCMWGKPYCLIHGVDSDPNDPNGGSCRCRTKEQEEERRRPLPTCLFPVLERDDGNTVIWRCVGNIPVRTWVTKDPDP